MKDKALRSVLIKKPRAPACGTESFVKPPQQIQVAKKGPQGKHPPVSFEVEKMMEKIPCSLRTFVSRNNVHALVKQPTPGKSSFLLFSVLHRLHRAEKICTANVSFHSLLMHVVNDFKSNTPLLGLKMLSDYNPPTGELNESTYERLVLQHSPAGKCEPKRNGNLWTQLCGKITRADNIAVNKGKSHMPPGRNACVFKDLGKQMHVSIYHHNLQSKKKEITRAASKLQLQTDSASCDHTISL